ncbi:MAG TPA: hypothetical protein VIJ95_15035 [Hanamia sp.]
MKKILFVPFLLLSFTSQILGQNKITKYCEIVVSTGINGHRIHISLSSSKVDSLFNFKDPTVKINLNKVTTFKTIPDVINYMSSFWDGF